jgi:hypothetical protein
MLLLALSGCPLFHPAEVPVEVEPPVEAVEAPVGIPALLARTDALLASVEEVDRRDRLVELRDLLSAAAVGGVDMRARVALYAERVLAIEERAQPAAIAESPMEIAEQTPIVTVPIVSVPIVTVPIATDPDATDPSANGGAGGEGAQSIPPPAPAPASPTPP